MAASQLLVVVAEVAMVAVVVVVVVVVEEGNSLNDAKLESTLRNSYRTGN